jgi:phage terminase small subunit
VLKIINMAKTLSIKQQALVSEYLKDYNKAQAAIRAGYKESSVRHNTAQIYKPHVMEAIEVARKAIVKKAGITAEAITEQLARIAGLASDNDESKLENVNVGDKLRALELLGKSLAMFTDNVKQTGDGLTINVTTKPDQPDQGNIRLTGAA